VKVVRQDVDKHFQKNSASHMLLLAKANSSLKEQCLSLTYQNKQLKDELNNFKVRE
jgi:hypothetical protein